MQTAAEGGQQKAAVSTTLLRKDPEQARQERVTKLDSQVRDLQALVEESQQDLERANRIAQSDLQVWRTNKKRDLKTMLQAYCDAEIAHHQSSMEAWDRMSAYIDAIVVE
jgi:hypothetical protein